MAPDSLLSAVKEMIEIYHRFESADVDWHKLNILFNAAVKKVEEEVNKAKGGE
jgi:hypothetical protein